MKHVNGTAAAKSIRAIVIMKGARHVATIQAHYAGSGGVLVNVFNMGPASKRAADAIRKRYPKTKGDDYKISQQSGHAGGYGYDKFAAALSGCNIDGHFMSNHCDTDKASARLLREYIKARETEAEDARGADYWRERARRIGASFANWQENRESRIATLCARHSRDPMTREEAEAFTAEQSFPSVSRYTSLHRLEGTRYLEARGYNVITAI